MVRPVLLLRVRGHYLVHVVAVALLREAGQAPFHLAQGTALHRKVARRFQGQAADH